MTSTSEGRVVVLGGTGHIGSFLVPGLVAAGFAVRVVSRGRSRPYVDHRAWNEVTSVVCDRATVERDGSLADVVDGATAVVDLTCFGVDSARLVVAAMPAGARLVQTGSLWAYGRFLTVPTTEESPKAPLGEYGTGKARVEQYLLQSQDRVRATVIHPGHITGPGWVPINPAGHLDLDVYASLITEGRVLLPERGMGLLAHVHAADVAALHLAALQQPEAAAGEAFNSAAAESMTMRGYAERVAAHCGHELHAQFLPWPQFARSVGPEAARLSEDHVAHSPHASIAKAERLLGFRPTHSGWDAAREAIDWLVAQGRLPSPPPRDLT